jgi:phage terminase large subunit-like protein
MTPRDYVALARGYEDGVLSGAIDVCKWVRLACERNRRDRQRAETGDPTFPYRFEATAATRVCLAAEQLPHIKGPKAKIVGRDEDGRLLWATIVLEPWQCWFITTLFGWLKAEDGLRRFRIAIFLVPRKNAKSTTAAAITAYMLTSDGESGPECYSAATTREQARVVAEILWGMAKRSPQFRDYFGVRVGAETTHALDVPLTGGKFRALSADANTLDGLNVSLAVVDELHAHKTGGVWEVLDTATGARPQPLILATSTAGKDIGGICYAQLQYLQQVLEGVIVDEAYFGVNYTIDAGDDWKDERTWRKANPNFGVSIQPSDMVRKARQAAHSPSSVNNFLTKHLNVWVSGASAWMDMPKWIALGDPTLRLEDFAQFPCWIGVDLAEVRDIAALVAVIQPEPDRYVIFGRYYLPESAIDESPIAQYPGWVRGGQLIETSGNQADYLRIENDIVAWCDQFNVQEIDFDRALAAQMGQSLKRRLEPRMGPDAVDRFVITVPQTVETMNPAMQTIERLVLSGHIRHDGNPALTWMMSNVVVARNHKDEIYPRKAGGKDSNHKIDGAVALFTAISRTSGEGPPDPNYCPLSIWGND